MNPSLRPISLGDLIRRLRALGFEGPFAGARHHLMRRQDRSVRIPTPHGSDAVRAYDAAKAAHDEVVPFAEAVRRIERKRR